MFPIMKTTYHLTPSAILNRAALIFGFAACVVGLVALQPSGSAKAQDMTRELQNIKRDLADLQRYVYQGQTGTAPTPLTPGASDTSSEGSASTAQLQVRIQQLEHSLRESNGKVEEVQFRLRQLDQRLETALADIDYRLTELEGGTPAPRSQSGTQSSNGRTATAGSTGQAQPIIPVPGSSTTVISSEGSQGPGSTAQPSGAGTLGTLIVDAQGNVIGGRPSLSATQGSTPLPTSGASSGASSAPRTAPTAGPVDGGDLASASQADTGNLPTEPQALYDHSLGLLRQGDYNGAESALKVFLDQNSNSSLVSSALYWLGETYYVRDNYRDAAFSFVDVYSKYPKSAKAPDSLLKLGMSLHALGNKGEACTAFATLRKDYPDARRAVLKLAEDRGAQYGC